MKIAVYAGTRNLYNLMITAAKSLLMNSDVDKIYMLIEDKTLPVYVPDIIETINVSKQTYFKPDGPNMDKPWFTYMAYMRAALAKIFPNIDKILSLDVDTIVDRDISDIWDLPIDDYYFSASYEMAKSKASNMFYANTGVCLFNLKKIREDGIDDKVIDAVNTTKLICPEQDAFAIYCQKKILDMPSEYNATRYTRHTDNPKVIHYAGYKKWADFPEVKDYEIIPFKEVIKYHNSKEIREQKHRYRQTRYMIHACHERMWYVNDFLIPSMVEQGIDRDDILIWEDKDKLGNLESFMQSMKWIGENESYLGGIWHLQDDVVISSHFKEATEQYNKGIACGFCNEQFDRANVNTVGLVTINSAWFSFQCIRIPNYYALECAKWYYDKIKPTNELMQWRKEGKHDDVMWKEFLRAEHKSEMIHNIPNNLVDHIDYLIGGSHVNKQREGIRRGYNWREPKITEDLERALDAYNRK